MNFTFMIILLLIIITFITYKSDINHKYIVIILISILTLNEIYNYKENYQNQKEESRYYLPAYDYAEGEFDNIVIPPDNIKTRDGINCKAQKKIIKTLEQHSKLHEQNSVVDNIYNYFEGKTVDLKSNSSIFDPLVSRFDFTKEKCPSVCHLIEDEKECSDEQYIPSENQEQEWRDYKRFQENCKSKNSIMDCNDTCGCRFDVDYNKCEYDQRNCIFLPNSDSSPNTEEGGQCQKRCQFLKNKIECNTSFYDNGSKLYCNWDERDQLCLPKCELYRSEELCNSDQECKVVNNRCVNR